MFSLEYFKKVALTLFAAAVAIPTIAMGFYVTYRLVVFIGT